MQDYRNIRRTFLYNKALRKFNKHNKTALFRSSIHTMYCIMVLGGKDRFVPVGRVYLTLKFIKTDSEYRNLLKVIDDLHSKGYISNNEVKGKKLHYQLTVEGINILNTFETCLRKERWDR